MVTTTTFHSCFPDAYQVSIRSFNSCIVGYVAILDVWQTERYQSINQYFVFIKGIEVVDKYLLPSEVKWNCTHQLEENKFLLGSQAKKEQEAYLAVFVGGEVTFVRRFYKGFSTNILKLEATVDRNILIRGEFYEVVQAGGHDDYYPQPWTNKITTGFEDASGGDETWQNRILINSTLETNSSPGDYILSDKYFVKKYNSEDKMICEQDIAKTGEEKLFLINYMTPYFKSRGENPETDGVWAAGRRMYADNEGGTGFSTPILFRLSSGGTIINYTSIFQPYQHVQTVNCVISDKSKQCFILGETLSIGKGNGHFLMHFDATRSQVKSMKYFNYIPHTFDLATNDHFVSGEIYHDIKHISPLFDKDSGRSSFTIFGNVSHYLKNIRDVGIACKIECFA